MNKKIVMLCSGGIDSSVCCIYFTNEGYEVYPLFINYGQNSVESEWEAVLNVCNAFKLNSPQKISVPEIGTIYPTLITSFDKKLPEELGYANIMAYFPYRNLFLLTIAAIYAAKKHIQNIGIGLVDTGEGTYRDCSPEFVDLANSIISFEKPLQILAPFAGKSKETVIDYGNKQGLDFSITYSCSYQPKKPCLKCASCQSRMEACLKVK